ncbi:phycoerythrobilin:ferredoxin oxidoreductase [Synechococcus sp. M16CYN]|uniref:phycoerythrobilin:ferredoxin oxidoreductase n=1 Tax=Synechococcus sp. M16CYN TaxID=3103139 RepID=UPI0030E315F4
MNAIRHSSTDPINIPGWSWQPFLEDAINALKPLTPRPYPVAEEFLFRQDQAGSKARPVTVTTATWGCKTEKFRQVRAACVDGGAAVSVLNFVINPLPRFDLPFFGGDLVTLPSGHLLALDLQPADKSDAAHTQPVWDQLMPIFKRWRAKLPDGGLIPQEAQPFFSPGFLWIRLPLGREGDHLIETLVRPAFGEYLNLYLELAVAAKPVTDERRQHLLAGQRRYSNYRAEKDPARRMLTRFHGSDWTERYIHQVLFDL